MGSFVNEVSSMFTDGEKKKAFNEKNSVPRYSGAKRIAQKVLGTSHEFSTRTMTQNMVRFAQLID